MATFCAFRLLTCLEFQVVCRPNLWCAMIVARSLPCSTALCGVGAVLLEALPLWEKLPLSKFFFFFAANGTGTLASQLATLAASANSSNTLLQTAASVATACVTGPFVGVTTQTGWHFNPDYSLFGTDYISRARKAPCWSYTRLCLL